MTDYKAKFLDLCVNNDILRFGEFTLKSGRISPYFFNAGELNNGNLLAHIGRCYAQMIVENIETDFMLYGPAYKGIPLAAATAVQLFEYYNRPTAYAFNRKEIKDHGEGGHTVGAKLEGNVIIIDDVITAGTSVNESADIIHAAGANICAIVMALDRQEVADGEQLSAVKKVEKKFNVPVLSLLKLDDLTGFLESSTDFQNYLTPVAQYRNQYGYHS